eukprot:5535331-Amphidinium_carterae.1
MAPVRGLRYDGSKAISSLPPFSLCAFRHLCSDARRNAQGTTGHHSACVHRTGCNHCSGLVGFGVVLTQRTGMRCVSP